MVEKLFTYLSVTLTIKQCETPIRKKNIPVCAVKLCHNHAGNKDNDQKITFHRFPMDPVIRDHWTLVIQRTRGDYWSPHKTSVVCSKHFSEDEIYETPNGLRRRLKNGAVPSRCLFLSAKDEESSTNIQKESSLSNEEICVETEAIPSCSKETTSITKSSNIDNGPTDVLEDFSDLESIFDTAREEKLRKKIRLKIIQEHKHRAIIKSLRKKNITLQKKNESLKKIIETLRKQRLINADRTP